MAKKKINLRNALKEGELDHFIRVRMYTARGDMDKLDDVLKRVAAGDPKTKPSTKTQKNLD